jgi:hypothetical protein
MTLLTKVREMFGFGGKSQQSPNVETALLMARAVRSRADDLNEQIAPYMRARDPFQMLVADTVLRRQLDDVTRDDIDRMAGRKK